MTTITLGELRASGSTIELSRRQSGLDLDDLPDTHEVDLEDGWHADDGNADVHYDWVETGREAAQEYVDDGDWGEITETTWVDVWAWREASITVTNEDGEQETYTLELDRARHTITLDPEEPECDGEHEHDWQAPYSVLGGLEENPGVWGHGGGVILKRCCAHCGRYMVTDTWAQRRDNGEQGLESVSYEPADDRSTEWAEELAVAAVIDAVAHIAEARYHDGRVRINGYTPDSNDPEYGGDTSPGSAWDEECDRLLAEIDAALPAGWTAEWSDDDIIIDRD